MKILFITLCLVLLTSSCGKNATPGNSHIENTSSISMGQTIPGTEMRMTFQVSRHGILWNQHFTEKIISTLEKSPFNAIYDLSIHQSDLNELGCPKLNASTKEQKMLFWVAYFATIANVESGYLTNTWIWDRYHKRSSGLLMISSDEANEFASPITKTNYSMTKLTDVNVNIDAGAVLLYLQLTGQITNEETKAKLFFYNDKFPRPTVGIHLKADKYVFIENFRFYITQMNWCRN